MKIEKNLLTKEEEITLFNIINDENASQFEKTKAENRIVQANTGLVYTAAKKYFSNGSIPAEDLMQEGFMGLTRAIKKFDVTKGFKFSTMATRWIARDIGRAIRTKSDVIHIPEHVAETARIAKAAITKFENEHGRIPTAEEFEAISGISKEKADEAILAVQKTTSIHVPVGDDKGTEMGDLIKDENSKDPGSNMIQVEGRDMIADCLSKLAPKNRFVLAARYGTLVNGMSIKELSEMIHIPVDEVATMV